MDIFQDIVPFHKLQQLGGEDAVVAAAIANGEWNKENAESLYFLKKYYPDSHLFFTNSCSSALEMALRALGIGFGDEVIIPGFGYVAVANAVVNNGAIPVYADVHLDGNIDISSVEQVITNKTKAVIAIHYAGNAMCAEEMKEKCNEWNIYFIEDAAQAIGNSLNGYTLGSFGHIGALSFDYMKNITCGQGGLIIVNDLSLLDKVQITHQEGTDKYAFFQGKKTHYQWVGKGSNFKINPLATHFLAEQLKNVSMITEARRNSWSLYYDGLTSLAEAGFFTLPSAASIGNGHIFYIVLSSEQERFSLRKFLKEGGVHAEFHYSSMQHSQFGKQYCRNLPLPNSEILATRLLRLPLWNGMAIEEIGRVVNGINRYFVNNTTKVI